MSTDRAAGRLTAGMLGWGAAAAMLIAAALGPLFEDAGAFRWLQIALVAVGVGGAIAGRLDPRSPLPRSAWLALLLASFVWLETAAFTRWLGFTINGVDFSIFDWMLENTARGRLAFSPIYGVNHLGVHSSLMLLILTPLYVIAPSPIWLLVLGPLLVWLGLFPVARLVRWASGSEHPPGLLLLAAMLAWLGNAYLGRLVNDGFRIESGLPVLALWFLVGWVEQRRAVVVATTVGLLLTKEDSGLWLLAFAAAAVVVERSRWREAGAVASLAGLFLVTYLGVVQPRLLDGHPTWGGFWSQFGPTPLTAALGMLRRPLDAAARLATSGIWGLLAPLLFLPVLSKRALVALTPGLLLLGTATYEAMHRFGTYYPAPLVPLALFGVLDVLKQRRLSTGLAVLALAAFPLFHDGYVRSARVDFERREALRSALSLLANAPHVCAQPVLMPQLGYPPEIEPIFDGQCSNRPGSFSIMNTRLNPWPLSKAELEALLRQLQSSRRVIDVGEGFLVVCPVDS